MTDDLELDLDLPEERQCPNPDYHDWHQWGRPDQPTFFCPGIENPVDVLRDLAAEWDQMPQELRTMAMRVNRVQRYREMENVPSYVFEHARALVAKSIPQVRAWLFDLDAEYADADLTLLKDRDEK